METSPYLSLAIFYSIVLQWLQYKYRFPPPKVTDGSTMYVLPGGPQVTPIGFWRPSDQPSILSKNNVQHLALHSMHSL